MSDDIYWILNSNITGEKVKGKSGTGYVITEKPGPGSAERQCVITYSPEGRMLFDGVDIETEDFMAYVGLLDMINDGETEFKAEDL